MHAPDPILTANLYSAGGLDELLHGVVRPFRDRLAEADPDGEWSVWGVRYARRGEHLKLRVHGPASHRGLAERLLGEAANAHFAALAPADPELPRLSRNDAPAVDAEDEGGGDLPDRTLLLTTYRRSPVTLGPQPLPDDDGYAARATLCLARGADLVLDGLQPDATGKFPGAARQKLLLRAVIGALAGARFSPALRESYLGYHRDWLLRFSLNSEQARVDLVGHYDSRVEAMGPGAAQIGRAAEAQWGAEPGAAPGGAWGAWREAVADLVAYMERFRGDPAYDVDPFAADVAFPGVFKVLHGLANQAGVKMTDEAWTHHLVLRAACTEGAAAGAVAGA
ncbi:MAG TPA: lantibiotic dehydratase C-terminal domain-containing protein [Longimicrobiaceae bacterium]|nr:lantibiotic dehydratase C-terminal domain-containing protein [Longimicrobiaceae bacterium]